MASMKISDLRIRPDFLPHHVQHVWEEWWQPRGTPRAKLEARAREALGKAAIPFTLIAHDGDRFLGTVSVIESDLDLRPELRPWVAALWVAPEVRKQGIGAALAEAAVARAFAQGEAAIHLYASPHLRPFYQPRWTLIESGVGPKIVDIYRRTRVSDL